jgi:hypothetical protein
VGKILRLLTGYLVLCALLACLGLLLIPRHRLAGEVGLAVCAVLIVAWWLLVVRSHRPAGSGGEGPGGLTAEERRAAAEDPQSVYWVDRLRRGPGPGGPA